MLRFPEIKAPRFPLAERPKDVGIKTDMENGTVISRARFTAVPMTYDLEWSSLSNDDKKLLSDFYRYKAKGSSYVFEWPYPVPESPYYGMVARVRFSGGEPDFTYKAPNQWDARVSIETDDSYWYDTEEEEFLYNFPSFRCEAEAPHKGAYAGLCNVNYANQSGGVTGWSKSSSGDFSGGEAYQSVTVNDYCEIDMYGAGFTLIGSRYSGGVRKLDVYIDGVLDTTVDCTGASTQHQQTLYSKTFATVGRHKIKLQVNSTTNSYIVLDAFDIIGSTTQTVENSGTTDSPVKMTIAPFEQEYFANGIGKVAGSLAENKNTTKWAYSSSLLGPTSDSWTEFSQSGGYNPSMYKDGMTANTTNSNNTIVSQNLIVINNSHLAPSADKIKDYARELKLSVTARGSGPSGNGLTVQAWDFTAGTWSNTYRYVSTSAVLEDITITIPAADVGKFIGTSGESYLILYAEATDGVTASSLYLDYWQTTLKYCYANLGTNAIVNKRRNLIPANSVKFEGWTAYQGAQVTVTQGISVPEWGTNEATRIQTSGGSSTLKYFLSIVVPSVLGQYYSSSVLIENIGDKAVNIFMNLPGTTRIVTPGQTVHIKTTGVGNGVSYYQFQFSAPTAGDSLDFIVYQPMANIGETSDEFSNYPDMPISFTTPIELKAGDKVEVTGVIHGGNNTYQLGMSGTAQVELKYNPRHRM